MALNEEEMRKARLSKIAYIPQGAMNSLNPVTRIGAQMVDAIKSHISGESRSAIEERCVHALRSVDLDPGVFRMYAHELSGGMKQRVCIAIGILLQPQVIIADEPTSALDVVTQRQVMETIDRVQDEINAAVILIGHDMGLMAQFVDRVAVMYAGRLVELSHGARDVHRPQASLFAGADRQPAQSRQQGRVPGHSGPCAVAAAPALAAAPSIRAARMARTTAAHRASRARDPARRPDRDLPPL